jgi:glycerol-3-phosphate dehydrogenase
MDMEIQTLVAGAGTITMIGTAWLTVRKIAKDAAKTKKEQAAEILHAAKEADALMKSDLDGKIEALRVELGTLESNVNKDMDHLKQTYNGEIRNLGQ